MSYRQEDPRRESARRIMEDEFETERAASIDTFPFPEPAVPRSLVLGAANIPPAPTAIMTLGSLSDVDAANPMDEQVLQWDSTESMWKPESLGSLVSEYDDDDVDTHLGSLTAQKWVDYANFGGGVRLTLGPPWDWLVAANRSVITAAADWYSAIGQTVRDGLATAVNWAIGLGATIRAGITETVNWAIGLGSTIRSAAAAVITWVAGISQMVRDGLTATVNWAIGLGATIRAGITETVNWAIGLGATIRAGITETVNWAIGLGATIRAGITETVNWAIGLGATIRAGITGAVNWTINYVQNIAGYLAGLTSLAWRGFANFTHGVFDTLGGTWTWLSTNIAALQTILGNTVLAAANWLNSLNIIWGNTDMHTEGNAAGDIDLRTWDVVNVDRIFFSSNNLPNTASAHPHISGYGPGLTYLVPASNSHTFRRGTGIPLTIGSSVRLGTLLRFGQHAGSLVNGSMWLSGTDIMAYSGGAQRNLSNISGTSFGASDLATLISSRTNTIPAAAAEFVHVTSTGTLAKTTIESLVSGLFAATGSSLPLVAADEIIFKETGFGIVQRGTVQEVINLVPVFAGNATFNIDMNKNDLESVDRIFFESDTSPIYSGVYPFVTGDGSHMNFFVPSGEEFGWRIGNTTVIMSLTEGRLGLTVPLRLYGTYTGTANGVLWVDGGNIMMRTGDMTRNMTTIGAASGAWDGNATFDINMNGNDINNVQSVVFQQGALKSTTGLDPFISEGGGILRLYAPQTGSIQLYDGVTQVFSTSTTELLLGVPLRVASAGDQTVNGRIWVDTGGNVRIRSGGVSRSVSDIGTGQFSLTPLAVRTFLNAFSYPALSSISSGWELMYKDGDTIGRVPFNRLLAAEFRRVSNYSLSVSHHVPVRTGSEAFAEVSVSGMISGGTLGLFESLPLHTLLDPLDTVNDYVIYLDSGTPNALKRISVQHFLDRHVLSQDDITSFIVGITDAIVSSEVHTTQDYLLYKDADLVTTSVITPFSLVYGVLRSVDGGTLAGTDVLLAKTQTGLGGITVTSLLSMAIGTSYSDSDVASYLSGLDMGMPAANAYLIWLGTDGDLRRNTLSDVVAAGGGGGSYTASTMYTFMTGLTDIRGRDLDISNDKIMVADFNTTEARDMNVKEFLVGILRDLSELTNPAGTTRIPAFARIDQARGGDMWYMTLDTVRGSGGTSALTQQAVYEFMEPLSDYAFDAMNDATDRIMVRDASSDNTIYEISPFNMVAGVLEADASVAPAGGDHLVWIRDGIVRRATFSQIPGLGTGEITALGMRNFFAGFASNSLYPFTSISRSNDRVILSDASSNHNVYATTPRDFVMSVFSGGTVPANADNYVLVYDSSGSSTVVGRALVSSLPSSGGGAITSSVLNAWFDLATTSAMTSVEISPGADFMMVQDFDGTVDKITPHTLLSGTFGNYVSTLQVLPAGDNVDSTTHYFPIVRQSDGSMRKTNLVKLLTELFHDLGGLPDQAPGGDDRLMWNDVSQKTVHFIKFNEIHSYISGGGGSLDEPGIAGVLSGVDSPNTFSITTDTIPVIVSATDMQQTTPQSLFGRVYDRAVPISETTTDRISLTFFGVIFSERKPYIAALGDNIYVQDDRNVTKILIKYNHEGIKIQESGNINLRGPMVIYDNHVYILQGRTLRAFDTDLNRVESEDITLAGTVGIDSIAFGGNRFWTTNNGTQVTAYTASGARASADDFTLPFSAFEVAFYDGKLWFSKLLKQVRAYGTNGTASPDDDLEFDESDFANGGRLTFGGGRMYSGRNDTTGTVYRYDIETVSHTESDLRTTDTVLALDMSAGGIRKVSIGAILGLASVTGTVYDETSMGDFIGGLPQSLTQTTIRSDDLFMVRDTSEGPAKKITYGALAASLGTVPSAVSTVENDRFLLVADSSELQRITISDFFAQHGSSGTLSASTVGDFIETLSALTTGIAVEDEIMMRDASAGTAKATTPYYVVKSTHHLTTTAAPHANDTMLFIDGSDTGDPLRNATISEIVAAGGGGGGGSLTESDIAGVLSASGAINGQTLNLSANYLTLYTSGTNMTSITATNLALGMLKATDDSTPSSSDRVLIANSALTQLKTTAVSNIMGGGGTVNLGSVSQSIIPATDNLYSLGSSSRKWRNLYVGGDAFLTDVDINGTLNHDGNTVGFFGVTPATRKLWTTHTNSISGTRSDIVATDLTGLSLQNQIYHVAGKLNQMVKDMKSYGLA